MAPQPVTGESSRSLGAPSLHFLPLLASFYLFQRLPFRLATGAWLGLEILHRVCWRESLGLPADLDSAFLRSNSLIPAFFLPTSFLRRCSALPQCSPRTLSLPGPASQKLEEFPLGL